MQRVLFTPGLLSGLFSSAPLSDELFSQTVVDPGVTALLSVQMPDEALFHSRWSSFLHNNLRWILRPDQTEFSGSYRSRLLWYDVLSARGTNAGWK